MQIIILIFFIFSATILKAEVDREEINSESFEKKISTYLLEPNNIKSLIKNIKKFYELKKISEVRAHTFINSDFIDNEINNPTIIDIEGSPFLGPKDAKNTLVIFSDFECPFCKKNKNLFKDLLNKFPNDLKIVFKHLPLPFHPSSKFLSTLAIGAHLQDKFWEVYDYLYDNQYRLSEITPEQLANDLSLDILKLKQDLVEPRVISILEKDMQLAKKLGVIATPTYFLNGINLKGLSNIDNLKKIILGEDLFLKENISYTDQDIPEGYTKINIGNNKLITYDSKSKSIEVLKEEWRNSAISEDLINLNLIAIPSKLKLKNGISISPLLELLKFNYSKYEINSNTNFSSDAWTYLSYNPLSLEFYNNLEVKMPKRMESDFQTFYFLNKYENTEKPSPQLLRVTNRLSNLILKNNANNKTSYGDGEEDEDKDFWKKFFESDETLIITEGAKKAASIISTGIAAIGLPGICKGFLSEKDKNENKFLTLIKDLEPFTKNKKRQIIINFDNDSETKVRKLVFTSTYFLAKELKNLGINVRILNFFNNESNQCFKYNRQIKGADDFIAAYGSDEYISVLKKSDSLDDFEKNYFPDINKKFKEYRDFCQFGSPRILFTNQCIYFTPNPGWIEED